MEIQQSCDTCGQLQQVKGGRYGRLFLVPPMAISREPASTVSTHVLSYQSSHDSHAQGLAISLRHFDEPMAVLAASVSGLFALPAAAQGSTQ